MRVLLVIPWTQGAGGVISVVRSLAIYLQAKGYSPLVFTPGQSEITEETGSIWGCRLFEQRSRAPYNPEHPIRSVLAFLLFLPLTLFQLASFLRREEIEIVNVHFPTDRDVYFIFLRILLPIKLIVSVHGIRTEYSLAHRLLLFTADRIVAPSGSLKDQVSMRFPRLSSKFYVIHNGVDIRDFKPSSTPNKGQEQSQYVLSVSVLRPRKGIDVLIRAFRIARQAYPNLKLVIAGDGPARSELELLVQQLELDDAVIFAGKQPRTRVIKLFQECCVATVPSRIESFGIVVIEAMACAKAVIASRVGGIPEIISHNDTGILVDPDDPQDLAVNLLDLLQDRNKRQRIGAAARSLVESRFSNQIAGQRYESLYSSFAAK